MLFQEVFIDRIKTPENVFFFSFFDFIFCCFSVIKVNHVSFLFEIIFLVPFQFDVFVIAMGCSVLSFASVLDVECKESKHLFLSEREVVKFIKQLLNCVNLNEHAVIKDEQENEQDMRKEC